VPLSIEAQLEARVLMMSSNNILGPSNGKPIIVPSQDIILGLYYLTIQRDGEPGEGSVFGSLAEIKHAIEAKSVTLHTKIKYRAVTKDKNGEEVTKIVDTTPGRAMLFNHLPDHKSLSYDLVNRLM